MFKIRIDNGPSILVCESLPSVCLVGPHLDAAVQWVEGQAGEGRQLLVVDVVRLVQGVHDLEMQRVVAPEDAPLLREGNSCYSRK